MHDPSPKLPQDDVTLADLAGDNHEADQVDLDVAEFYAEQEQDFE